MSAPAPASIAEAMDMVFAGLSYVAAADPTALAGRGPAAGATRRRPRLSHSSVASQRRVTSAWAAWKPRTVGNPGGAGWSERSVK